MSQDGIKIYQQRIQELKRGMQMGINVSNISSNKINTNISQKIESTENRISEYKRRQQSLLQNRLKVMDEAYQTAVRLETARHQNTMNTLINPLQKQLQDLQSQQENWQWTQRNRQQNKQQLIDDNHNDQDDDDEEIDIREQNMINSRSNPRAKITMKIVNNKNNCSFNESTMNSKRGMLVSQKLSSSFTQQQSQQYGNVSLRDHTNYQYQQGNKKGVEQKVDNIIRGKVQLISVIQGKENTILNRSIAETSKEGSSEYLKYRKIPLGQSKVNSNITMNINCINCSTNSTSRSIESHQYNKGKQTARNEFLLQKQQNQLQKTSLKPSTLRRQSLISRVLAQEDNLLTLDDDSF